MRAPGEHRHAMDAVERTVSRVLAGGIIVAATLMIAGLVLGAAGRAGIAHGAMRVTDIPHGVATGDPAAYLSLGLVALIATPFVRVAGSIIAFWHERDLRFVAVTALAFVAMCVSVLLGWT